MVFLREQIVGRCSLETRGPVCEISYDLSQDSLKSYDTIRDAILTCAQCQTTRIPWTVYRHFLAYLFFYFLVFLFSTV